MEEIIEQLDINNKNLNYLINYYSPATYFFQMRPENRKSNYYYCLLILDSHANATGSFLTVKKK